MRDEVLVWPGEHLQTFPKNVDVVIPKMHRIDAALMDTGEFRLIQQWGAGLEGVDLVAAQARGIAVANVPASGDNADSVAEHAMLLVLSLLRKLPLAMANVRSGVLGAPLGTMLAGRAVCLYGLGAVALSIAKRLRAFGPKLIGLTRDADAPKVSQFGFDRCFSTQDKDECLKQTDVLILCVRYSEETRDVVGAHELTCLPAGAIVVNVARGGLVDYEALHASLRSGHLGGVGLDVFWNEPISADDPILQHPNVIATPHIAGITSDSLTYIARAVADNIERLRAGKLILNRLV